LLTNHACVVRRWVGEFSVPAQIDVRSGLVADRQINYEPQFRQNA
jgi:hypothetical protein